MSKERYLEQVALAKELGIALAHVEPFCYPIFITRDAEAANIFLTKYGVSGETHQYDGFATSVPGAYFMYIDKDAGLDTWYHESLHIAVETCVDTGIEMSVDNQEYLAYMQGYIADLCHHACEGFRIRKTILD